MRILVGVGTMDGVTFYRLVNPYLGLRARGHEVIFHDRNDDPRIPTADVLVMSRMTSTVIRDNMRRYQAQGVKVVFDLDDNVHEVPPENPASQLYGVNKPATKVMEDFIREADVMTVSTPGLYHRYSEMRGGEKFGGDPMRRIQVCPNLIADAEFEQFTPKIIVGAPKMPMQIRIGWAGSDTHRGDFVTIMGPLSQVMREFPETVLVLQGANMTDLMPLDLRSRVRLTGTTWEAPRAGKATSRFFPPEDDHTKRLNSNDVENPNLPTRKWYKKLVDSRIDIGLAPLASILFNEAKSYVKLLEYGLVGIPVIASDFGSYRQYGDQALHMNLVAVRLATSGDDWLQHLRMLITSARARAALAIANRDNVERDHLVSKGIVMLEDALAPIRMSVSMRQMQDAAFPA